MEGQGTHQVLFDEALAVPSPVLVDAHASVERWEKLLCPAPTSSHFHLQCPPRSYRPQRHRREVKISVHWCRPAPRTGA